PDRSARSASVFTKQPTGPSTSGRSRLATAAPTTTSPVPAQRAISRSHAASSTMYGVAPSPRASACTPAARAGGGRTARGGGAGGGGGGGRRGRGGGAPRPPAAPATAPPRAPPPRRRGP